ncbi:XTP/dITP diphosphatase [Laceyella putida]|uniref:dITP/XTP pyrophosphatase n=1 Tax=Laceyella putida TaxID=110101 RepID=A0ABW2RIG9_9BACL
MKKDWPFPHIIIATKNKGKLKQFADLFQAHLQLGVKGLDEFPELPEIVEDQDTFEGNALKKAETIAEILQVPVISDDSGLVVPALHGAPGIYSARYAGEGATDDANNEKLLAKMREIPDEQRQCFYVCAMALAVPGEASQVVRGECHGRIIREPRGHEGFGYDPLFYVPEEGKTMAELSNERKYQISHRAEATRKLIQLLKEEYAFGGKEEEQSR